MASHHWLDVQSNTNEEIDDLVSFAKPQLRITDEIVGDERRVSVDALTDYISNVRVYKDPINRLIEIMRSAEVDIEGIAPTAPFWPSLVYSIPSFVTMHPMGKRNSYLPEESESQADGIDFKNALNQVCMELELDYESTYDIISPLFASYWDLDNTLKYIFLQV